MKQSTAHRCEQLPFRRQHTQLYGNRHLTAIRFMVRRYANVFPSLHIMMRITISHNIFIVKTLTDVPNIFELHDMGLSSTIDLNRVVSMSSSEHILRHPNVQMLMHNSPALTFDLVLVEEFHQLSMLMFGHQFDAPIVSVATFESAQHFNEMFGVFGAWSHVPHHQTNFDARMTFLERVQNVWLSLLESYLRQTVYMPAQQELADKYFGHLPGKIDFSKLRIRHN